MKKITLLLSLLLTMSVFGQSSQDQQDKQWRQEMTNRNGFPATPGKSSTSDNSRVNEASRSFPVIIPPRKTVELTKDEIEEIKKSEETLKALRSPRSEDLDRYSEFLKQKNTGMFRLFPDLGCGEKLLVSADEPCASPLSLSWSYSFIYKNYGGPESYDLRLKDNSLIADGFLSQSILAPLGDVDLNSITLNSPGMKFLRDFKPEKKSKKAKEQFAQIAKKVNDSGYVYGKIVKYDENQTYVIRLINYKLGEGYKFIPSDQEKIRSSEDKRFHYFQYANRADKILVFRVIRKDSDGSVTILWKEFSDKKAPTIIFDKNEKLSDLKSQ